MARSIVRILVAALVAAGVATASGCGGRGEPEVKSGGGAAGLGSVVKVVNATALSQGRTGDGTVSLPGRQPSPTDASVGSVAFPVEEATWVQVSLNRSAIGEILVDIHGSTLYAFEYDTTEPIHSACSAECAATWSPITIQPGGKIYVDGVDPHLLGFFRREDGMAQLTVASRPVYRYAKDLVPGDLNGQGVGGTWFAIGAEGKKNAVPAQGAAVNPPPGPYYTTTLTGKVTAYGFVIVDQSGATVYRRLQDSNDPPIARCGDACARIWQPVTVKSDTGIRVEGADAGKAGTYRRPDGMTQVTWQGWPLYRNAADRSQGTVIPGCAVRGWAAIS